MKTKSQKQSYITKVMEKKVMKQSYEKQNNEKWN